MAKKPTTKGTNKGGVWKSGREREVTKAMRDIERARKVVVGSAMPPAATRGRGEVVSTKRESGIWSHYAVTASPGGRIVQPRPTIRPRYRMEIAWSAEDNAYLVTVPDLPGCVTHGTTYVDAARMGEEAIEAWLDGARHWGRPIPLPGSAKVGV